MEPLYTLKGNKIWYSKYFIGKSIRNRIYIHKDYALDVIPTCILWDAQDALNEKYPNFKYNCICYNPSNFIVRFDEAPDFDNAREPCVGKTISYNPSNKKFKEFFSHQIWHHKWLWVDPDYTGFDVQESYEWSKFWLSKFNESASGSQEKWKQQLKKVELI